MKLHELKTPQPSLLEELDQVWEGRENLDEGIFDTLKSGFNQIGTAFTNLKTAANNKGELNDKVIRQMYLQELEKFRGVYDRMPEKIKDQADKWLVKAGIKLQGIDVSRKNFNRIIVLKVLRLVLFTVAQMRDNGIQFLLSTVVSGGMLNIISLLMNANDAKSVGAELINSSKQLKLLFDKAKETSGNPPQDQ